MPRGRQGASPAPADRRRKAPSRYAIAQSRPLPSARQAARIGPPEAAMRAIGYARVSTDEQDSGLQHQRRGSRCVSALWLPVTEPV
jgi:hypothetical protein